MKVILISAITSILTTSIYLFVFNLINKTNAPKSIVTISSSPSLKMINVKSEYTLLDFFGDDCVSDVSKFCSKEKSIVPVAHCLKKHSTLLSKKCLEQDNFQKLNFVLSCAEDIESSCQMIKLGGGRLINCLRAQPHLTRKCHSQINGFQKK